MPTAIKSSINAVDLSPRFVVTTAITGSPAAAAETIIATLTLPQFGDPTVVSGIDLSGWATFTVGTSGTAVTLRIRQTGLAGTVVVTSGALTGGIAATNLLAQDIEGFDAAPGIGVYVMTLQVTAGAAASTVTAVKLRGILIQMEPLGLGRATFGENADRLPLNAPSRQLANSIVVKTGDGWLYGFTVTNTKGSAQFVQVFDAHDLPADGAVPLISKSLAASDAVGFAWLPPRRFEAGLVLCNSTTQATKTIGAADCLFDAQYIQGRRPVPTISGGGGGGGTQGAEVGYDQITASVTVASATEATGTTIISAAAHVFDGSPVLAEFFAPVGTTAAVAGAGIGVNLFEGATEIGRFLQISTPTGAALQVPLSGWLRFTPTAASHTYTVTAYNFGGNGSITAGVAGTAAFVAAFLRFTKV